MEIYQGIHIDLMVLDMMKYKVDVNKLILKFMILKIQ